MSMFKHTLQNMITEKTYDSNTISKGEIISYNHKLKTVDIKILSKNLINITEHGVSEKILKDINIDKSQSLLGIPPSVGDTVDVIFIDNTMTQPIIINIEKTINANVNSSGYEFSYANNSIEY